MEDNTAKYWFSWFYEKWEKNAPGELIEQGLTPSQIAERFVNENHDSFIQLSKKIDEKNYDALTEFMKLSESCLLYTSPSPRDVEESRMPSSA